MTHSLIFRAILMTGAVTVFSYPAAAQQLTKDDVQAIIKDYIGANPELIVGALDAYREKQEQEYEKQVKDSIVKHMKLFQENGSPAVGAKNADITIVEFFDYNCGYCKRAFPDIQELVKNDSKVKVIFQEMPILSPSSSMASKWALAAQKQDKYFEFHTALMNFTGNKTEDALAGIAKDTGLDVDKMRIDAASKEIEDKIAAAAAAAREIGVEGTPAFIINETLYRGYMGEGGMKEAIAEERKKLKDKG